MASINRQVSAFACAVGLWAASVPGHAGAQEAGSEPQRADAARLMNELMTGSGPIGGSFLLTDQQGRRVGPMHWRGKVVLMYFGYTFCPDACPTSLSNIAAAIEALGADGRRVQPVFVTLDPLRDRPKMLGAYVKSFNPGFVTLGGIEEEVRRVALSYKVSYEKVWQRGSDYYLIDHTSFTYVLDREGRYVGYFPPGTSGNRMSEQVRSLLPVSSP
ncbi:MAG: SCO family protein [Variovorax sp.]|nr:MAG: SCO family protein [Variovorax sp.]